MTQWLYSFEIIFKPKIIDSLPIPNINCFKISSFMLRRFYTLNYLPYTKPPHLNH